MGMSQYCCSSTLQRSFCSSHREIISANNSTCPSSSCTKEAIVKGEMAINVKGPINGAVSSTPLQNKDQTQEDVGAIKIQAIFRGHRARRASSSRKENGRRTMRMSQNLLNRVRRKFRRTSHRGIIDTITTEETAAIFENAIGGASSIPSISRKKDLTKDDIAAIKIQAFFRGHLARRAFLALRSLVKLQAVVCGVCVRRQARVALHCMHALARLQVSVRARQLLNGDQELS
ncbi:hypothetical protein CIPAW_07G005900 [Carya illinoinensis]|uniref:Uncharacterized protein n=1 Tax=Carya illinoinensis TaxID=32201 RepID=A0A8T1Q1A0_CARIL|nr:hypothetical protein CIPAW_07G005900 [Carya illinoinensis]